MHTAIFWKEKNIIRLDDHQIVLESFTQWCQKEYPEIMLRNYKNSDEVFLHIVSQLIKGEKIDLFITDFVHDGLNGYEMCLAIRAIERALNRPQMPILLLTLCSNNQSPIKEGLEEGIFTKYMSLTGTVEELVESMEELIIEDNKS